MDDRALFDLGSLPTGWARDHTGDLLDHQLDVGTSTYVGEDAHAFETNQRDEDLTRVDEDEGASCL